MNKTLSLVIVLLLLVIGSLGVMYFGRLDKGGLNFATNDSTQGGAETATDTSNSQLEADLESIELEDPSADFTSVDSDIDGL